MATSTTPQPYTADRPENSTTSVDANPPAPGCWRIQREMSPYPSRAIFAVPSAWRSLPTRKHRASTSATKAVRIGEAPLRKSAPDTCCRFHEVRLDLTPW